MIDQLIAKYPLISDQVNKEELKIILTQLYLVIKKNVVGDVVEMGCYVGTTSLFIERLLNQTDSTRKFHVYDSFEGLPSKTQEDSSPAGLQFSEGQLSASKKDFIKTFHKSNLRLPVIHKAWFSELALKDLPEKIAFVFLDGDYYSSIKDCLNLIEPNLMSGSIVIVDDYQNLALPGAKRAVDEWLKKTNFKLNISNSLAIIQI